MVPDLKDMPYSDRLRALKLPTLSYRRIRGDMIEAYKVLNGRYDNKVSKFVTLHHDVAPLSTTRGHSKKLYKKKCNLKLREHFFSNRVTRVWNSLPEDTISAPSLHEFELPLDDFWSKQDVKYNFLKTIEIYHSNNTPNQRSGSEDILDEDLLIKFE